MGPSSSVKGGSSISVSLSAPKITELEQVPRRWGSKGGGGTLRREELLLAGPGQRHCCETLSPTRGCSSKMRCIFQPPGPSLASPSAWTPLVQGPPSWSTENSTHPKKEPYPTFKTLVNFPISLSAKKPLQTPLHTQESAPLAPLPIDPGSPVGPAALLEGAFVVLLGA